MNQLQNKFKDGPIGNKNISTRYQTRLFNSISNKSQHQGMTHSLSAPAARGALLLCLMMTSSMAAHGFSSVITSQQLAHCTPLVNLKAQTSCMQHCTHHVSCVNYFVIRCCSQVHPWQQPAPRLAFVTTVRGGNIANNSSWGCHMWSTSTPRGIGAW